MVPVPALWLSIPSLSVTLPLWRLRPEDKGLGLSPHVHTHSNCSILVFVDLSFPSEVQLESEHNGNVLRPSASCSATLQTRRSCFL